MKEKVILLVDNDFYTKIDFWEAFGDKYTIHSLSNGLEAYRWLLDGNTPDIIISEYSLAGYSGISFLKHIKSHKRLSEIPFIFICSTPLELKVNKARALGANDIYCRPLDFGRMRTRVEMLLMLKDEKTVHFVNTEKTNDRNVHPLEKAGAVALLILLSPFFLLIAALIKLDSKGPVLWIADKVGKGFRNIKDYRFRTEKWQKEWNTVTYIDGSSIFSLKADCEHCKKAGSFCSPLLFINDKSICERAYLAQLTNTKRVETVNVTPTRIGRILKKTRIDRLPNLINIIKGDMSFTGEAALSHELAETLTTDRFLHRIMSPVGMYRIKNLNKLEHQN